MNHSPSKCPKYCSGEQTFAQLRTGLRTGRAVNREVITISAVVPEVFYDPQVSGLVHLVAGHDQRGGVVLAPRVVVQPAEHAQPERAAHLSSVSLCSTPSQPVRLDQGKK